MNINGNQYIKQFLKDLQTGQVYNDAVSYGVQIQQAAVADGQQYWRVIGVHHLLPAENQGNLTILVEALDEDGNRIRDRKGFAAMTWQGRTDPPDVKALDKGSADPMGCDFPMFKEATHEVWMKGSQMSSNDASDRVAQLHTRHPDEAPGNTLFHHSFFVVFQRTRKGPTALNKDAMLKEARRLREVHIADNSPLAVYALEHNLGAPITLEFSAGGYRGRGFVKGVVFAPLANAADIAHVEW